jgi:peroxiredoxin
VIVVEDNKVTSIDVEPEAGKVTMTGAKEVLAKL